AGLGKGAAVDRPGVKGGYVRAVVGHPDSAGRGVLGDAPGIEQIRISNEGRASQVRHQVELKIAGGQKAALFQALQNGAMGQARAQAGLRGLPPRATQPTKHDAPPWREKWLGIRGRGKWRFPSEQHCLAREMVERSLRGRRTAHKDKMVNLG